MASLKLSILLNQESSQGVWESFLNYEPLPELMQGAGAAILTLLVSFAIGIILHHLNDRNKAGGLLDLHVALDYVWMFKPSLVPLLIVVTSPFFMGLDSTVIQSIIFVFWLISLGLLVWIVVRLYGWVKGDKHPGRLGYLSRFPKSTNDKLVSWNDLWSTSQIQTRFTEKDYFIAFSNQIDALLKQDTVKSWHVIAQLLADFHTHIDKRDKTFLLVFDEFFPKILEWHHKVWLKQFSQYSKENNGNKDNSSHKAIEADLVIDQMIKYVTKESLVDSNGHTFSYFDTLRKHIEAHKSLVIEGTDRPYEYLRYIPIYEDCFEFIPQSPDSYNIWEHYFPTEWKINLGNLMRSPVARTWLRRYLEWAQSRIWKQSEEWDKQLEDLNKGLFDSVDPITWAKVHTFVFKPRKDTETKMETMIKHGTNFGYSGRTFSGWGDDFETMYRQLQEEEIESTINLALHIFGKVFTENNIKVWQDELALLEYPEDSTEYGRIVVWKAIFNKMLEHIKRSATPTTEVN